MYRFYLDGCLLPVTPAKVDVKVKDYNEVLTLIDGSEAVFPKKGGSREYSFEAILPNREYPFAVYEGGRFRDAKYYLDIVEQLKDSESGFLFIIERDLPDGKSLFDTCENVVVGALSYAEGGNEGVDIRLSLTLKEYNKPQAKKSVFNSKDNTIKQTNVRESENRTPESYVVKGGDSLWKICKKFLGDGGKYKEVAGINGIGNPDLIYPGQVIRFE